jgi:hypothetical protein
MIKHLQEKPLPCRHTSSVKNLCTKLMSFRTCLCLSANIGKASISWLIIDMNDISSSTFANKMTMQLNSISFSTPIEEWMSCKELTYCQHGQMLVHQMVHPSYATCNVKQ